KVCGTGAHGAAQVETGTAVVAAGFPAACIMSRPRMISTLRFLGIRILLGIVSLWGVRVLAFRVLRVGPGDPAPLMAPVGAAPDDVERIRREFGLAGSWWTQYGAFLNDLLHGQFGRSLWLQQDARRIIVERLPATLELAMTALLLSVAGGIL